MKNIAQYWPLQTRIDRMEAHARKRMKERYKLDISREMIHEFRDQITSGTADCVQKLHVAETSSVWKVYFYNRHFYAVYDHELNCICTFLSPKRNQHQRRGIAITKNHQLEKFIR